jgi:outer membrane protein
MNNTSNQRFILRKLQAFLIAASVASSFALAPAALAQEAEAPTTADGIKIGFVNTEQILRDSKPAREAQEQIEEEFGKRDEELQKLAETLRSKYEEFEKNAPVMSDADRSKAQRELTDLDTDLQRKRREFQEDFNRRRNDAFSSIVEKANVAIHELAAEESYDLILQDAVTVSERIDITTKVIEVLDKK